MIFTWEPKSEEKKPREGWNFSIIHRFTGITEIGWCVLCLDWDDGKKVPKKVLLLAGGENLFVLNCWHGEGELIGFFHDLYMWVCCNDSDCGRWIVRITCKNYLPWIQARCTSSMWERGTGMIAGENLCGRYCKLLRCGVVRNLGLQMTPENDISEKGGSFGMSRTFWDGNATGMWWNSGRIWNSGGY